MDKKLEGKLKADFDLHVLLLMKRHHLAKSKAVIRAWWEGPAGLEELLKPQLVTAQEVPDMFTPQRGVVGEKETILTDVVEAPKKPGKPKD